MIVADTSAWVEYLRGTGHAVDLALRDLIAADAELALTEVIVMEVLAGARSPQHLDRLRSRLLAFPLLTLTGLADYEEAAAVYRACRRAGESLRTVTDCLIAVPALREDASILHNDRDFDAIARHTELRIEPVH
jgi:predicted nucleic acid-binding protein